MEDVVELGSTDSLRPINVEKPMIPRISSIKSRIKQCSEIHSQAWSSLAHQKGA